MVFAGSHPHNSDVQLIEGPERFAMDLDYIGRESFQTDVKIILRTVLNVIVRKDINLISSDAERGVKLEFFDLDVERKDSLGGAQVLEQR